MHDLDHLNDDAARRALAQGRVPLHAAAVERAGRVVALCGPSGAGKSTLAAAGVIGGLRYVADEIVAVDPLTLDVTTFHRPIGLRPDGARRLGVETEGPPSAGGSAAWMPDLDRCSDGGRLVVLAVVARRPGPPDREPVTGAGALVDLVAHTVVPDGDVHGVFDGLERLVRSIPVVRLRYGELTDGVALVEGLLRDGTAR